MRKRKVPSTAETSNSASINNKSNLEETDVPPAFDQSIEDIMQIKNQESQNQTASINFSSREDFQTIIDQMLNDGYCSNLVNESTDPESKLISDEKWENLMGFNESDESNEFEFRCNENLDSHDMVPEADMPIYPGHRMTVNTSMMLILLYTVCHTTSGAQLADMLTLISVHCLQAHPGLSSLYMFKRYFASVVESPLKNIFIAKAV